MKIHGLQKMTLLDYPGKVACTVFFGGCDLRCPFCHNSELLDVNAPALMEDAELLRFLESRRGLLEGVCLTGGEPLMRPELPDLCRKIKELGYPVKLDTNGLRPAALKKLIQEKLIDYVAMDIKNSPDLYAQTGGREALNLEPLYESIRLLKEEKVDYEFRTTVVAQLHKRESFPAIGQMIQGAKRYYLQRFTDRDSVLFSGLTAPSPEEMKDYLALVAPYVREAALRGV